MHHDSCKIMSRCRKSIMGNLKPNSPHLKWCTFGLYVLHSRTNPMLKQKGRKQTRRWPEFHHIIFVLLIKRSQVAALILLILKIQRNNGCLIMSAERWHSGAVCVAALISQGPGVKPVLAVRCTAVVFYLINNNFDWQSLKSGLLGRASKNWFSDCF